MPECPVCGSDIPVFRNALLMRRTSYCNKCGARIRLKPSSVLLLGILGGIVTTILVLAIGSGQHEPLFLLVFLAWIFLYLYLYSASAKFKVKSEERKPELSDSRQSDPPTHH